jgi:phenylpropionate dioxygenase-like ring-hydroxylating dioxygenase large terminal subunit
MLCRSADIPPGAVIAKELVGHPIVLFRTHAGKLHALDAHCTHMGTHLGSGNVVGDCLRCPLHHWRYDGTGQCQGAKPGVGQRAWPVVEKYGGVMVFYGTVPLFDPPGFDGLPEEELCTRVGRSVTIQCAWMGISSNAFDMRHLDAVHQRALRETPTVELLDPYRLRLKYVSRVTGHGLPDRVMKWLSDDHIRVCITSWGGTGFTVESRVGRQTSMLLLSLMPTRLQTREGGGEVNILPLFVRRRKGVPFINWIGIRMASWLFTRFLEKDIAMMRGMRYRAPAVMGPDEEPLRSYLRFIEQLPKGAGGFAMEGTCGQE